MSFARSISEALRRYWTKDQADARYYPRADVDGLLAGKAPLASPPLTGTPTAPTAAAGTSTTQLATTAFVAAAVLPKADSTAVGVALAQKVNVSDVGSLAAQDADSIDVSGGNIAGTNITDCAITNSTAALVGTPTAPTAAAGTNTTQLATCAFVHSEINLLVGGAGSAYDTLKELQDLIVNDESGVAALTITVAGKLAKTANLSDLASAATARTNLGLGALATLGTSPTLNNLTTNFAATVGTALHVLDPTNGLGGVFVQNGVITVSGANGLDSHIYPFDPAEFPFGLKVGGAGVGGDTPGMVFDTTGDTAVTDSRTVQFRNLGVNTFGWELADGEAHSFGNAGTHHRWAGDTKTDNSGTVYEHAAAWGLSGSVFTPLNLAPTATSGTLLTVNAPSGFTAGGRLLDLQNNGASRLSFNDGRTTNGTMMKITVPTFNGTKAFVITLGNGSTTGFSVDDSGNVVIVGNLSLGRISLNQINDYPTTTLAATPTYNPTTLAGVTLTTANIAPTYQIDTFDASSFLADLYVNRQEKTHANAATTYTVGNHFVCWFGVGGVAKITGDTSGNLRIAGSLGVGNSAAATTLGAVVKKVQIFDAAGTSLGYIPVYDAIT